MTSHSDEEDTRHVAQQHTAWRSSAARWQRLFAASSTGITSAHTDSRFISANPAYCALVGRSEAALLNIDLLSITHPDDREQCREGLRRVVAGEVESISIEKRYLRPDGSEVWAQAAVSLMQAEGDVPPQLVAVVQDIDAHKRAQERLARNHTLIALAGRMAGVGGWAVELPSRETQLSDELLALMDCPPGHVPGLQERLAWYPPGAREMLMRALDACLDEGTPFELELDLTTSRQRPRAVRTMGQAVRDASGRIVGAQGAVVDQTEHKRAERVLRESEERFRNVARATADAVWDWDLASGALWWNEGMQALFGHTAEELEPGIESWTRRIHPDDVQRVVSSIHAVIDGGGERWSAEYRFLRRGGGHATVADRGFVMRDAAGRARRMVGGMSDLTAQREAETRLRQQAALLDEAQEGIVVRDMDERITYWNRGAERLYGWTAEEALGRRAPELLQHETAAAAQVRSELLAHGACTLTLNERRKDGRLISVEGRWTLVRDSEGRPSAIFATKTDVTQRLELEAQLQQGRRLEAVGQLTGGVAHDFNNLLTVILGNADLLAEQLADQPLLLPLAEMTRTAAERGAELTQRLLAFARRQALQPQAVDTHQLLAGMDALLRRTLPANIELELVRAAGLWPAMVDPVQLESAVLNLALNARDAMPDGGKITLETANAWIDQAYADRHADVSPGQYVLLSVSDTGSGMGAEQLARAFEPFFTTKGVGKGSGLGLSMVYGFVKQSHGHVKLYSEPGHGTTARLYLPRADSAPEAPAATRRDEQDFRGSATVLVVEDDALVRRHAQDVLAGLGYRVLGAENGDAALVLLRQRDDIDLLFTDVVMPGALNGRQLAEAALQLRPALKVLYTSGYTENAIVHHGRLDRGVHLLPKPYRSLELARKVHLVLQAPKAGRP
jgi:PAS domain S-box-containing protein